MQVLGIANVPVIDSKSNLCRNFPGYKFPRLHLPQTTETAAAAGASCSSVPAHGAWIFTVELNYTTAAAHTKSRVVVASAVASVDRSTDLVDLAGSKSRNPCPSNLAANPVAHAQAAALLRVVNRPHDRNVDWISPQVFFLSLVGSLVPWLWA